MLQLRRLQLMLLRPPQHQEMLQLRRLQLQQTTQYLELNLQMLQRRLQPRQQPLLLLLKLRLKRPPRKLKRRSTMPC
jgi:hypothetical protein